MEEKNELNDIILNKGGATNSNKKIILAVATLGIILIIVVMLMNSLSSNGTDNLPQAALPPEPQVQTLTQNDEEPLFEEVEIVQDDAADKDDEALSQIAQKLKQESLEEDVTVVEPIVQKKKVVKKTPKKVVTTSKKASPTKVAATGSYYIQVGSFSKYEPNKKFLKSITSLGFHYKYHKVNNLNKVLVGPFKTSTEAKNARRTLRAKVEPGAFLVKL
jgi:DedD protein